MQLPDPMSTLEKYGIRGVSGNNIIAQTIFIDAKHSIVRIRLASSQYTDEEKLGIRLELFILGCLLGDHLDPNTSTLEDLIPIYQRTYAEWLVIALTDTQFSEEVVTRQLAHAWTAIEELFVENPPR